MKSGSRPRRRWVSRSSTATFTLSIVSGVLAWIWMELTLVRREMRRMCDE